MQTPTLIYCADGNQRFAEIAIRYGFTYGAQLPNKTYFKPEFVDQNWRNPVRETYMKALAEHRPRLATVLDWEQPEQLPEVLSWATEAAQYVSEAVIIIPKVVNGVEQIPREIGGKPVRLGYSVPTRFAGTQVPMWEFRGWPIHLLGGSPNEQLKLSNYLNVASVDGNYSQKMAIQFTQFFSGVKMRSARTSQWPRFDECGLSGIADDLPYHAFTLSCINIRAAWQGAPCTLRYASEADLPAIKAIANQYKNELGFVNTAALKTAITKNWLFVAVQAGCVVGFVNLWRRRDGITTIYEIAVAKSHRSQGIGRALLLAAGNRVQLKCTTENTANAFYEKCGMHHAGIDPGKQRQLNIWQSV